METKKIACFTWVVVVAASLFADGNALTNSFESAMDPFKGDGALKSADAPAEPSVVGYPLPSAAHTQILEISGSVSNTFGWAAADTAQVDMMVRVSVPEDPLESLSGASPAAQFAIGVESNGYLCVWAKDKNADAASWLQIGSTHYEDDTWFRLSLNFDYNAKRCQVLVGGQSVISSHGYLTATDSTSVSGSWYTLAGEPASGKSLSAVCITGSAGLDDFVAQSGVQEAGEEAFPVADNVTVKPEGGKVDVKVSYLNKYGLSWDSPTAAAPDGSGMKIEEKYIAGLDPTDGSKFELKDAGFVTEGGKEYMSITIPGELADPEHYTYVVETAASPNFESSSSTNVTATAGKVMAEIPNTGVKYFKVKISRKQ